MVREVRIAWNDPDEFESFRRHSFDEDDLDDGEDSPLDPPPKRRCSRRHRPAGEPSPRTNPVGLPTPLPNPPADFD